MPEQGFRLRRCRIEVIPLAAGARKCRQDKRFGIEPRPPYPASAKILTPVGPP